MHDFKPLKLFSGIFFLMVALQCVLFMKLGSVFLSALGIFFVCINFVCFGAALMILLKENQKDRQALA
ncbi:MAG: hypothetical protein KKH99_09630, partial [Proteobacteria bacterium]|nr:hypothetical protein [Pseudomonadota bacterium]